MKKTLAAAVVTLLISSQALATNWGTNDTENKNIEGVVLLNYINGNYPKAGTLIEKLNPFKSKYKTLKQIKRTLAEKYDMNGDGSISSGSDYEDFYAENAEAIVFADTNNDGNLDQAELDVLEALAEEVSNSKGSTLGCDAVTTLGDKLNLALPIPPLSIGSLIPFRDKCAGM